MRCANVEICIYFKFFFILFLQNSERIVVAMSTKIKFSERWRTLGAMLSTTEISPHPPEKI